MPKDEPREAVNGLPQIQRQYEGAGAASDLGGMNREERAAKYRKDMHREVVADLEIVRGQAVKRHRASKQGGEMLDSKFDRWYRSEEWTDDGEYVGEPPCVRPPNPDASVVEEDERQAKARSVLAAAERRTGVKPAQLSGAAAEEPKKRGRPAKGKT